MYLSMQAKSVWNAYALSMRKALVSVSALSSERENKQLGLQEDVPTAAFAVNSAGVEGRAGGGKG